MYLALVHSLVKRVAQRTIRTTSVLRAMLTRARHLGGHKRRIAHDTRPILRRCSAADGKQKEIARMLSNS